MATLEDLGLVKAADVLVSDSSHQSQRFLPTQAAPGPPSEPPPPTAPRETLEYRTALELELWKEEQEDLFDDQVTHTCNTQH